MLSVWCFDDAHIMNLLSMYSVSLQCYGYSIARTMLLTLQRFSCSEGSQLLFINNYLKEFIMWTKPAATEMRFGFEVTMYVMNK